MTVMQSDETKISLIGKDISYIQKDIAEIKSSVKELSGVYATQVQLREIEAEVQDLKKRAGVWQWLSPTLSAVVVGVIVGVMEYLIIFAIQHK